MYRLVTCWTSLSGALNEKINPPIHSHFSVSFRFQPSDSHGKTETILEVGELEGDTLDPQTGLFYRSSQPASSSEPTKQTAHSAGALQQPHPSQTEAEQSRHSSTSAQQQPPPPPPPQLQSKPQPSSSSSSTPPLTKKIPKLREQSQPKPQTLTQSPKDRPPAAPTQSVAKVTTSPKPPVTPQLPKLQQAPTSHHRPLHTSMSHPPPLQAHHPVSTEKTSSQVSTFTPVQAVNYLRLSHSNSVT